MYGLPTIHVLLALAYYLQCHVEDSHWVLKIGMNLQGTCTVRAEILDWAVHAPRMLNYLLCVQNTCTENTGKHNAYNMNTSLHYLGVAQYIHNECWVIGLNLSTNIYHEYCVIDIGLGGNAKWVLDNKLQCHIAHATWVLSLTQYILSECWAIGRSLIYYMHHKCYLTVLVLVHYVYNQYWFINVSLQ